MLPQLINLVKNVGCQFTFGIFTKWDECIRKAREEGQQSIRNVIKTANDYMKEFCEVLQGKGKAYFVNVKNFENHDTCNCEYDWLIFIALLVALQQGVKM
ncbi:hypothetical protein pdam_00020005 [Pocillopora damicornis]|uniref:Uncharacterized protein n=1 Tax=Pocillopora damicornis TaxID=46731 RepID=A0A3M6TTY9_POCDA|nr:hypothetical protein pdam_00020005 [Pocillopora damicornis]